MKTLISKFSSRKFWVAISQIATGILILCNFSETQAGVVAGAIVTCMPAIVYMIVEGKVDIARAKISVLSILETIDTLSDADLSKLREKVKAMLEIVSPEVK